MFDLNLVKPFLSVYQFNSITKASESLGQTQPAVSAAIKRFEKTTGYPLFVRTGRSIEPTSMAHKLARQLSEALELMEGAVSSKRDFVVYTPANLLYNLPMMDGVLLVESPVSVEEIMEDIHMNRVDLVIDAGLPRQTAFSYEQAVIDSLVFITDPEVSDYADVITMEEYAAAKHITLKLLRQEVPMVDLLSGKSLARDVAIEVRSITNLLLALKGTSYIAAWPKTMLHLAKIMNFKIHQPPFELNPVEFELVFHKKYQTNVHHKELRDRIRGYLNN
ncbi:LysR family transcriptional regulator [Vibrio variabilis]|uniref:LysR family transcriptional regulator n=1 Tax=Vibrio variabilis TaxID=990271 RepID=UPI000DD54B7D|nr:LysR family transcriptional regulator [Vibrio variabilis]